MTDRTCRVRWTWTDAVLEECKRVLDAPERERLARFQHDGARRSFLAGRVTLRVTLGEVLDVAPANVPLDATCSRCGAPHGKPRVAATTDIEASLSHANGLVAVAVTSAGPVGVDVEEERHGEDLLECSDLVLGQTEFARLGTVAAPDRAASLLRAWTRKEAIPWGALIRSSLQIDRIRYAAVFVHPTRLRCQVVRRLGQRNGGRQDAACHDKHTDLHLHKPVPVGRE